MKKILSIHKILQDRSFTTKVQIFLSNKASGDDFDNYENNFVFTNLNPITIKALVREITPETAFWKQYGLHQSGMKEILTEKRHRNMFEHCNKIVIEGVEYQVFKTGTGINTSIIERPNNLLRIVISRLD